MTRRGDLLPYPNNSVEGSGSLACLGLSGHIWRHTAATVSAPTHISPGTDIRTSPRSSAVSSRTGAGLVTLAAARHIATTQFHAVVLAAAHGVWVYRLRSPPHAMQLALDPAI